MCQEQDIIKTENDITEDNTLDNILQSENNGTVEKEFDNIYNENTLHLEKNKLNTGKKDQFSSSVELNTSKTKKCQSHKKIYYKKDIINKYRLDSITCENNTTINITPVPSLKTCNRKKCNNCTVCKKSFSRQDKLKLHMRIHTGEKPHKCLICEKTFFRNDTLKQHMRIHTKETPYECTVCKKSFNRHWNLKLHMRIHSGERSYECAVCKKSFNRQWTLKKHMRIHSRENTG